MNRVGKVALGCLLFPIGLLVLTVIVFLGARATGVPEPRLTQTELSQPVEESIPQTALRRSEGFDGPESAEVEPEIVVILEMEEGRFTVASGPAEEGIRVQADYDEATYRLQKNYDLEGETPVFRLRFRSTVSLLRRLAQDGSFSDDDVDQNQIDVILPQNVAMKLILRFKKAEAEIHLDGLALTDLVTEFRMGEYSVLLDEPNPVPMRAFVGDFAMGEFEIEGLANFRVRRAKVKGQLGECRIDFRESLLRDTEIGVHWKMGEVNLRVPADAFWDPSSSVTASLGEVTTDRGRPDQDFDPEVTRRLKVDASIFMGEI